MKEFIQKRISFGEVIVLIAIVGLLATTHLPR